MTNTIGATPEERERLTEIRAAFDDEIVAHKNIALRKAHALLESLISDRAKLLEALEVVKASLLETGTTTLSKKDVVCWLLPDRAVVALNAALNTTKGQSNGE